MSIRTLSTRLTAVVLSASLVWLSAGLEPSLVRAEDFVESAAPVRAEFAASPALMASVQASLRTLEPSAASGAGVAAVLASLKRSADAPEGAAVARLISAQLARDPGTLRSFSAAAPAERQAMIVSALSSLASSSASAGPAAAPGRSESAAVAQTIAETVKPWQEKIIPVGSDVVRVPQERGSQEAVASASAAPRPAQPLPPIPSTKRSVRIAQRLGRWAPLLPIFFGVSAFAAPDGMMDPSMAPNAWAAGLAFGVVALLSGALYGIMRAFDKADAAELAKMTPPPSPNPADPGLADAQAASMAPAPQAPEPPKPPRDIEKQAMLEDVAGQTQAKEEIDSLVDYLKNPEAYKALGAQGYKGVLLFGPPGTGKTLLARAIANEAGIPIVTRKGSEFIRMYVGKGADNIESAFREIREKARQNNSAGILYIDEIDAVGATRTEGGEGGGREHAQTLNQLLSEMDGFEKDVDHPIILMASTNRPELLDPALLRGGRFELQVPVGLPDAEGRLAVLKVHTRNKPLADDVDLREIARLTPGLAGADLKAVVNDAAMRAGRQRAQRITRADLLRAVERKTDGHERRLVMSEQERRVVSYHEGGHALVSHLLPDADPVTKITIVPHGLNALGYMKAMGEEDRNIQSQRWLVDRMAVALGGRAAEELMAGQKYSGASNDLEAATRIARAMVMKFGMSEKIGHVSYDMEGERPTAGRPLGESTKDRIEDEVKRLLDDATRRAREVLKAHKDVLERLAAELREKETLRGEDLERLIGRDGKRRP